MRAWLNHFALNLGSALACLFFAVVPPQWTGHSPEECAGLRRGNPFRALWRGLAE